MSPAGSLSRPGSRARPRSARPKSGLIRPRSSRSDRDRDGDESEWSYEEIYEEERESG